MGVIDWKLVGFVAALICAHLYRSYYHTSFLMHLPFDSLARVHQTVACIASEKDSDRTDDVAFTRPNTEIYQMQNMPERNAREIQNSSLLSDISEEKEVKFALVILVGPGQGPTVNGNKAYWPQCYGLVPFPKHTKMKQNPQNALFETPSHSAQ